MPVLVSYVLLIVKDRQQATMDFARKSQVP